MAYLGDKGRSEAIRFWLTLDAAPTGTPTISITRGQGTALDTPISDANMTQGDSTLEWYYNYTTEAAAQVGLYTAKYDAIVDTVARTAYDHYDVTIKDADDLSSEISAITGGSGTANIIISLKDGVGVDVADCKVEVYSNDDTLLVAGAFTTNSNGDTNSGNTFLLVDSTSYKVRMYKAGAVNETQTIAVSGNATHGLTVTVSTPSNPSDPDVCRLRIFPITLDNQDITDLASEIELTVEDMPEEIESQFIRGTTYPFIYDSSTTPDSYYFDAVRGSDVRLVCKKLGFDNPLTVPDLTTQTITAAFLATFDV
jgi:hypothetical protein